MENANLPDPNSLTEAESKAHERFLKISEALDHIEAAYALQIQEHKRRLNRPELETGPNNQPAADFVIRPRRAA